MNGWKRASGGAVAWSRDHALLRWLPASRWLCLSKSNDAATVRRAMDFNVALASAGARSYDADDADTVTWLANGVFGWDDNDNGGG